MTTYNSYEAAKIANQDSDIFVNQAGVFRAIFKSTTSHFANGWKLCDPADYCMTVEKFLAYGHKFAEGDVLLTNDRSDVRLIGREYRNDDMSVETCNTPMGDVDCDILILRAAVLEDKKPRTKAEYVKCEFDYAWQLVKEFEEGVSFYTCSKGLNTSKNLGNLLAVWNKDQLHRRIEIQMTEREAFVEALQELWIIDGIDGKEQMDKIVDSELFKLVN